MRKISVSWTIILLLVPVGSYLQNANKKEDK